MPAINSIGKSLILLVAVTLSLLGSVCAQWDSCGVAVCELPGGRHDPVILDDGKGGAFIVWVDSRHIVLGSGESPGGGSDALPPNPEFDLYAQYIDRAGNVMWDPEGVNVTNADYCQYDPHLAPDGEGGFIVTWDDQRDGRRIYAQRIDSTGALLWDPDGVAVCIDEGNRWGPRIISDDTGGAIITWFDYRSDIGVYAQRLDPAGTSLWTPNGMIVSDTLNIDSGPEVVTDGEGGAIITWIQETTYLNCHVYAQKVDPSGVPQWDSCGVAVCELPGGRHDPVILDDGKGGAFIVWVDSRHIVLGSGESPGGGSDALPPNPEFDLYAQYIDRAGNVMWDPEGVNVTNADYCQYDPHLAPDGEGGFIVTWDDQRDGRRIYAQRIDSTGALLWDPDGVAVCIDEGNRWGPRIISDDTGGAIITWFDYRSDIGVYAQRLDPAGTSLWTPNGMIVSDTLNIDSGPEVVTDGEGGAIITWIQETTYLNCHVYAQKVDPLGRTGDQLAYVVTGPVIGSNSISLLAGPNPFRSRVLLTVIGDCGASGGVSVFDVTGKLRRSLADELRINGTPQIVWDGRDDSGHLVEPGVYFCYLRVGNQVATRKLVLAR